MAGGGAGAVKLRNLDQTPSWAVAVVVLVIIFISIGLEKILHTATHYFKRRKKIAMLNALEKVKAELMILGFISLLLTFCQGYISQICIPIEAANTMLPCALKKEVKTTPNYVTHYGVSDQPITYNDLIQRRRLLLLQRRSLAGGENDNKCSEGTVPLISTNGLHQLHIFIFFLAVFHVIYAGITMMLGRKRIRGWKTWEREAAEKDAQKEAQVFRLTHETSFVKDHLSVWNKAKILFYFACFFRQFFRAIRKADYMSMRQGFITVHLAPGSQFNFQKYIKRSLEDDFKVIVGISPLLWSIAVLFLLLNVNGWYANLWMSLMPLIVTLGVGAKLQSIITEMAMEVQERHAVIQGIPLVQVSDRHFWFGWPRLVLHLIHLTLFQNAFEIIYFLWTAYAFGFRNCFHSNKIFLVIRMAIGVIVQILCSNVTLPLYALVNQMGSDMKRTIFDDETSEALKVWHKKAVAKRNSEHGKTGKLGGFFSKVDSPKDSPRATDSPRTTDSPRIGSPKDTLSMIHTDANVAIRTETPPKLDPGKGPNNWRL